MVITGVTLFWTLQIPKLSILTNFGDLLPQTHPYIKIHNKFRKLFGGANFLVMVIEVKQGDIFNPSTLGKITHISEELRIIQGIDRYKILSLAESEMKDLKITAWGMESSPLMWPDIPQTEEEMKRFKNAIWANPRYYGSFVSKDGKKSLILADFFEEALDYSIIHNELNRIRSDVEDSNHILSIVGNPMHLGAVRQMVGNVNYILIATALVIPILLYLAYRSFWAMLIVPSAGIISGIWGIGFMSMMGYNLDPLIFVMPFLISLMAFRHSHQLYNRFYEEYLSHGDKLKGARTVIENMFLPGLTSVVTDAFGIAIIAIVPIPLLRNVAVACAFWSIITVFIGLILTPILLCYIPLSLGFMKHIEKERNREQERRGFANHFADWLGPWIVGKRGRYTVIGVVIVILAFSFYWSQRLIVGDAQVGSNLLYPSSRYNRDSERINKTHPLINPLYIVVSGDARWAIKSVPVLKDIYKFTRDMLKNSGVQNLMVVTQGMHGNDPKWYGFPDNDRETLAFFHFLATSGDPGDTDRFIDYHDQFTNIAIFYKDKTGPTIEKALATAKEYMEKKSKLGEKAKY
jgi:predicted RND superfamily exporter protein